MRERRSKLFLVFVPEGRRVPTDRPVELCERWVEILLRTLTYHFGGATAYPRWIGAWRQGEGEDSPAVFDRVSVVETWIAPTIRDQQARLDAVFKLLSDMCADLCEEEVGCVVDGVFYTFGRK